MLKKLWKWKSVWLVLFGTTFLLLACGPATSNIEVDVQITQINTGEYNQSQVIDQVFGADYYKYTPELFEPDGIYRV